MNSLRRTLLKVLGASIATMAGWSKFGLALAAPWNKTAFESKTASEALKVLGASGAMTSKDIVITAPDIAEDGNQVPITVVSRLANTQSITILVEKNPFPLTSSFEFANGAEPHISLELKMAQSSNVMALVKADGKFFASIKEVKITIGGCGA